MRQWWDVVSSPRRNERLYRRRRAALYSVILLVLAAGIGLTVSALTGGGQRPSPPKKLIAGRRHSVAPAGYGDTGSALSRLDAVGYAHIRELARLGLPVYCGGPHGNEVAFTFDDGPGPYTYLALRKLREAGERATFFVVGISMLDHPGWVRRELAVATIGDHTYHHLDLLELTNAEVVSEILSTERMIEAQTGQRVYFFRPPYGAQDARVDAIVKQLGLLQIMWSMDSRDSLGANWLGIIKNVKAGLHPGAIILMHENRGQTIRALTTLLPLLHRRHLRSVSLPELFATDPPSVSQLRRGIYGCGPLRQPPVLTGS